MNDQKLTAPRRGKAALALWATLGLVGAMAAENLAEAAADSDLRRTQKPSDVMLRNRISRNLGSSASLAGSVIEIRVTDRAVTLKGVVGSDDERVRAARLASKIPGVRGLTNELVVDLERIRQHREVQIADEELAGNVAGKLVAEVFPWAEAQNSWLFGWEVSAGGWEFDVDADGGRITLRGTVDEAGNIASSGYVARSTPGVTSVDNQLRRAVDDWPYGSYRDQYPDYPIYPP